LMGLPEKVVPTFDLWCNALHPEDRARVLREFQSSVERQLPFESEFRFMRPDGSVRHVLSRGFPVSDIQIGGVYYLCLDLDVTQMVELQQRLAPAERLATLTRMATSIAHDLRTPLIGLEQGLQGLKYVADRQLEPAARQLLEDLHTGARLAVGIVQDILDLYRQAYGELPLSCSKFKVEEVAREVVELMRAEARDRCLTLTVEGQAQVVCADRRRIFRVLVNLIENAVKNSPTGGRVRVVISASGEDARPEWLEQEQSHCDRVTVAVEDEGQGLDPAALHNLFEPSRPLNTPTRGGTGLGLYLCKLVIGAHKGVLVAHNRPEGGARFVFDIPIDRRETYDGHPTSDRRRSASIPAQPSDGA
jgi:signal transduction histidine kinase